MSDLRAAPLLVYQCVCLCVCISAGYAFTSEFASAYTRV
jgi:hypothetical protein